MFPISRSETDPGFGEIFSRWVTLTEGQHYYFETAMRNNGGIGFLNLGMEVKPDVMPESHPLMETQVQRFSVS